MPKILVAHSIATPNPITGTGTMNFYFLAPSASYQGIETDSGVTVPDAPNYDKYAKAPLCTVEALLRSGAAVRKTLVTEEGILIEVVTVNQCLFSFTALNYIKDYEYQIRVRYI